MAYETVLYEKSGNVATVTLNRPDALNAFNLQLRRDLISALKEANADSEVGCIVFTGAGRVFSAGADVRGWDQEIDQRAKAEAPSVFVPTPHREGEDILGTVMGLSKPIIAAINGAAVGMGATIPVACDLRTAAEPARFGFVFAKRGVTPEMGSTFLLPRLVGWGRAREICYTGRWVDAKEAKEIGLVNEVFPAESFMAGTMDLARSIAANAPLALRFAKRGFDMAMDATMRDVVHYEQWAFGTCQRSDDFKEAVRAFLEKREPKFQAR